MGEASSLLQEGLPKEATNDLAKSIPAGIHDNDKKEFEIEFLQLQKNYLKVRNQAKDFSEANKT